MFALLQLVLFCNFACIDVPTRNYKHLRQTLPSLFYGKETITTPLYPSKTLPWFINGKETIRPKRLSQRPSHAYSYYYSRCLCYVAPLLCIQPPAAPTRSYPAVLTDGVHCLALREVSTGMTSAFMYCLLLSIHLHQANV